MGGGEGDLDTNPVKRASYGEHVVGGFVVEGGTKGGREREREREKERERETACFEASRGAQTVVAGGGGGVQSATGGGGRLATCPPGV